MISIRIHIIGGSGSGKSYISELLSEKLRIPHYDLDDIFWDYQSNEYGVRTPEDERDRRLREIISLDSWITEGVHRSWVGPSLAAADKIVVLMTPLSVQEERIWKRYEERIAGIVSSK
ncbi:DNA topology modulation protein FlaR [Paenibacillus sp. JX-17]|uniref:DNA topology modulation protein FlaR n=1 Tax=Paenibacillus lacisoli TaxID=3064525 RepID=A0ABT9CGL8_9BACL|nr:DNA topology modulation protein FlaR [Paenibacillus sp. JX-17]MDO7908406.1 DNA topology modulation protein FlaR [Paenibacillus sp. JX-17]